MTTPVLAIIAAVADNGVIGRKNGLAWRLKSDMLRFRDITMGKPVIMGRKTFESIGKPLPGRDNIVLSRDPRFKPAGVTVAHSLDEALTLAEGSAKRSRVKEIMVAGGAEIYTRTLPLADKLYLTHVQAQPKGDAFFPIYDKLAFKAVKKEAHAKGPEDEYPFVFIDYARVPV